jgi:hypothetical protein
VREKKGMLKFWKNKAEKQIEIEARSKQRAEDEKYWLQQLSKQRDRFMEDMEKQKKSLENEKQEEIQKIKNTCDENIGQWKQRVVEANVYISDAQKAWLAYKDFIPKAMDYANMLKTGLFVKQQEMTRQMGQAAGAEEGIEGLQRSLIEITPKIEKLLHFNFKGNNKILNEE